MKQKTIILVLFIFIVLFVFSNFRKVDVEDDMSLYISENFDNLTPQNYLTYSFENNETVTVGQVLTFYCRVNGINVKNFDDVKMYCKNNNIYLPSELVYNREDWENLWRNIVLNETVFEKVNEETYGITLIQGYLKIYLNKQGYELVKKGLIPPQLYFYSPFSDISDFESYNISRQANQGFILEVLMKLKYSDTKDRKQYLHDVVKEKVEDLTNVVEADWTTAEISLYNYYSLSYYGEYLYFYNQGVLGDIELSDLVKPMSVQEFLILYDKSIKGS